MKHLRTPCYMPSADTSIGAANDAAGNSNTSSEADANASNSESIGNSIANGGYGRTLNTNINPATQIEFNTQLDLIAKTTYSFRDTQDGLKVDANRVTSGYFDFDFDSLTTIDKKTQETITSGTLASHLYGAGVSAPDAHTAEAILGATVSLIMGQPIAAITPIAKALEVQGVIDAKTSHELQAVGIVASFMKGMVSSLQSLDAISTAKSYGAINNIEAMLMAGATFYSMYSGFKGLESKMQSLGFTVTASDLRDFGVSSDGDGSSYINGTKITFNNVQTYMSSFALYMANRNKMDNLKSDIFERMAGSIFYNNFAAGGDIFNPSISPIANLIASVGKDISYSKFVQMSYLQNDFVEVATNPYNIVNKFDT